MAYLGNIPYHSQSTIHHWLHYIPYYSNVWKGKFYCGLVKHYMWDMVGLITWFQSSYFPESRWPGATLDINHTILDFLYDCMRHRWGVLMRLSRVIYTWKGCEHEINCGRMLQNWLKIFPFLYPTSVWPWYFCNEIAYCYSPLGYSLTLLSRLCCRSNAVMVLTPT